MTRFKWNRKWFEACEAYASKTLDGWYAHYCDNFAGRPVDETCSAFQYCKCFHCPCGTRMEAKYYPFGRETLQMHDDIFYCPKSRFWNFWKHRTVNFFYEEHG